MIIYLGSLPASSIITSNIPRSARTWHSYHARQDLTQKYTNTHFQFHLLFSNLPHSGKFLYFLQTKVATQSRSQVFLIVRTGAPVWGLKHMVTLHFRGNRRRIMSLTAFHCRKMETTFRRAVSYFLSLHQCLWDVYSTTGWFSNFWTHQILPGGLARTQIAGPFLRFLI